MNTSKITSVSLLQNIASLGLLFWIMNSKQKSTTCSYIEMETHVAKQIKHIKDDVTQPKTEEENEKLLRYKV